MAFPVMAQQDGIEALKRRIQELETQNRAIQGELVEIREALAATETVVPETISNNYNWTAHPELDSIFGAGFTRRLQNTLVAIDDPSLLSALPRERLIAASNEEFDGIRAVAEALGMIR